MDGVMNYSYSEINFIIMILSRFRARLLVKLLQVQERGLFDNTKKSSKLLLEIMTLLSLANIIGNYKVFIVSWRSFM
jgi:hypothetical protein